MLFSLGGWDADALAFIAAASITNSIEKNAINTYVKGLKSAGLWTLITALYPFVGSNSTSNRYNLINPSTFLLTFSGGVTHNSDGVTFNGSSGYANTGLIPSTSLSLNNESIFLYSRTSAATATKNEIDMGAAISTTQRDELVLRNSANGARNHLNSTNTGVAVTATISDASGLFIATRTSATDNRLFRNSTQIGGTSSNSNTGTLSNIPIYFGARNIANSPNGFVARNFALAGAGKGFNTTQQNDFYTLTQAFQTTLGRQV